LSSKFERNCSYKHEIWKFLLFKPIGSYRPKN
jgi:hypothetical protein